ncbi:MAG: glycosyltransferase family 2 protein [Chitinophagaceae bacterium]|nr:MAG: glycosyltransferase family 2 protein [Chitinophagaceae bacterium]
MGISFSFYFRSMQKLSIVIVCKNEAGIIGETLKSFSNLTDDIIVYDNGSNDGTQEVVKRYMAHLHEGKWQGFGPTKNKASQFAKYDWILSLDADEAIDEELKTNLLQLDLADDKTVYELKFKNFFENKWLRFGEWGNDRHIRLFNRCVVQWNDARVHEELVLPAACKMVALYGYILHRTVKSITEYENKMRNYALMNAEKYFREGKRSSVTKAWLAAAFSFIKNYFFKLGFLDGKEGFLCARIMADYTFLKYKNLGDLDKIRVNRQQ